MKKYYEVSISSHHAGFGMYDCVMGDEGWCDVDDLIAEISSNVEAILELGVDILPGENEEDEVEDIRGSIYNEPDRIFAVKIPEGWSYVGINEIAEEDEEDEEDMSNM